MDGSPADRLTSRLRVKRNVRALVRVCRRIDAQRTFNQRFADSGSRPDRECQSERGSRARTLDQPVAECIRCGRGAAPFRIARRTLRPPGGARM